MMWGILRILFNGQSISEFKVDILAKKYYRTEYDFQ